jgi:hypothetical protein
VSFDALGDLDFLSPKKTVFVWRLTLTCGHYTLWGPFTDATNEVLIGDHTTCDMCPSTRNSQTGGRNSQMQLVVDTVEIDPVRCSLGWIQSGLT